ncbi:hypothetical protein [Phaeodactylibacter luteus]|uniref:Uncharacterized protein n=1 Tax=Phaeodactylibacter luteus TaxID=1564516 RepID=A0A5C6RIF1_9BACT|nr:hypothetical protein [Phaeodactylibacter luteus]TXB60546.1 hypothetical protein FRY97_20620 [Phaeodactylibacter luteus]
MKKGLLFALLLLALACQKEPISDDDTFFAFTVKIDTFTGQRLNQPADNLVAGQLNFYFSNDEVSLQLNTAGFDGRAGTYDITYVKYNDGRGNHYGTGTLVVTEVNAKREFIKGTFTASCSDLNTGANLPITEGEFLARYYE